MPSRCANVIGIKYSKTDIISLLAFCRIKNGSFSVMAAPLEMALAAFSIGCDGIVSGTCHVFTEKIQAMYRAHREGDSERAIALQTDLFERGKLVKDKEMAKCAAFLQHEGVIASDNMRAPLQSLSGEEKEELFMGMEAYKQSL